MEKNLVRGIFWAIVSSFWASIMVTAVKYTSTNLGYNSYVIVFWRSIFALLFMLPWVLKNGVHSVKTKQLKLYSLRAVVGVVAMLLWFYGLTQLALPQATALSFMGPIFTTISAILILGERPGKRRIFAIIIAFFGTMVIIRPGITEFNDASLIVLLATLLWSFAAIIIKKLSSTESPEAITFYMVILMTPMAFPLALIFWQDIAPSHFIWFALLGLTSNFTHTALNRAYKNAELTHILPFDFTRLIFIGIIAYLIFGDQTNIFDVIGSTIIIASNIYIAKRTKKNKEIIPPQLKG